MLVLTRVARYRIIHPVMATETQVREGEREEKGEDEGERRVYPVVCIVCVLICMGWWWFNGEDAVILCENGF